jgi:putative tryptophan/tyrosine transport system substrate-binding protein
MKTVLLLISLILASIHSVEAQQPKKIPRIGYLSPSSNSASESTRFEAIRRALRELGYIEGQNIAIEYRYAEGKIDRFTELAAELVRLKVDIIVVAAGGCMGPGGHECDQDGSHRYGGHRVRSCRGRTS